MGNKETHAKISAEMKQIDPDWPNSIFRKINKMSTEEYIDLLDKNNIEYKIVENEEQGRWFILKKNNLKEI